MSITPVRSVAVAAALLVMLSAGQVSAQTIPQSNEADLIRVLQSDAAVKDKSDACRQLAVVGTTQSVPVLVALLDNAELNHMARYALEQIPDPAVDQALQEALPRLQGDPLVGVIGSIAIRQAAAAAPALGNLLRHDNPAVARAAARALGTLATKASVEALREALPAAPGTVRPAVIEGLLRAAEARAPADRTAAIAIYDALRRLADPPHQVRTAALRGAILTRGTEGLPLLRELLRSTDYLDVQIAARTALEMPGDAVTRVLLESLGAVSADARILLVSVLGKRGDAAATEPLLDLTEGAPTAVRIAAVRALAEIDSPAIAPRLIGLQRDSDEAVAAAARAALASLEGAEVDRAIRAMLNEGDTPTRVAAIGLLGQRRTVSAVPDLLALARDGEPPIRVASLQVLGDLCGIDEFPALIDLLLAADANEERRAAEGALTEICTRSAQPAAGKVEIVQASYGDLPNHNAADITDKVREFVRSGVLAIDASNTNFGDPVRGVRKQMRIVYRVDGATDTKTVQEGETLVITAHAAPDAIVDALCRAVPKATPAARTALLRVLRIARGAKALTTVRNATQDADEDVRKEAVSLLCNWPAAEALPDVIELSTESDDQRTRILALRGCFRLIPMQNMPDARKVGLLQEALKRCTRDEERRLALSALTQVPTPEALAIVTDHVKQPALKEESALGAVAIGEAIVAKHPAAVATAMKQVLAAQPRDPTAKRADALLKQASKTAP